MQEMVFLMLEKLSKENSYYHYCRISETNTRMYVNYNSIKKENWYLLRLFFNRENILIIIKAEGKNTMVTDIL